MGCCSSKRGFRQSVLRPLVAAPPPPVQPPAETVSLHYVGRHELALKGPVSGRIYRVGIGARAIAAAPADVPGLVASGLFERA